MMNGVYVDVEATDNCGMYYRNYNNRNIFI